MSSSKTVKVQTCDLSKVLITVVCVFNLAASNNKGQCCWQGRGGGHRVSRCPPQSCTAEPPRRSTAHGCTTRSVTWASRCRNGNGSAQFSGQDFWVGTPPRREGPAIIRRQQVTQRSRGGSGEDEARQGFSWNDRPSGISQDLWSSTFNSHPNLLSSTSQTEHLHTLSIHHRVTGGSAAACQPVTS